MPPLLNRTDQMSCKLPYKFKKLQMCLLFLKETINKINATQRFNRKFENTHNLQLILITYTLPGRNDVTIPHSTRNSLLFTYPSSSIEVRQLLTHARLSLQKQRVIPQAPQHPLRIYTWGAFGGGYVSVKNTQEMSPEGRL